MQYSRRFLETKCWTALNTKNWFKFLLLPHGGKRLAEEICQMNPSILRKLLSTSLSSLSYQGRESDRVCHDNPSFWKSFLGSRSSSHKSDKAKPEMLAECNCAFSSAPLQKPFGAQKMSQARCVLSSSSGNLISQDSSLTWDLDVSYENLRSEQS